MHKLLILSLTTLLFFSCERNNSSSSQQDALNAAASASELALDQNGMSQVKASIKTVHGNIVFKFYPREAPITVTRIMQLIQSGFYDGLNFHRVVPNYVVQGGDPNGNGTGGSGVKLKAEFNEIQHVRGTVAMARSKDPDSADSQFYIALTTLPNLDRSYTVFGQVIEGLDLLDKISVNDKIITISIIE
jgi:cyclophilin family peptidyl-prolyl cis-trans isomerase